jgi:hypothetical protein
MNNYGKALYIGYAIGIVLVVLIVICSVAESAKPLPSNRAEDLFLHLKRAS